eukprot:scaffold22086_cov71-Cyclotella_meneghiniana.AAC.5
MAIAVAVYAAGEEMLNRLMTSQYPSAHGRHSIVGEHKEKSELSTLTLLYSTLLRDTNNECSVDCSHASRLTQPIVRFGPNQAWGLLQGANNDKKANNGKLPRDYYASILKPVAALTTVLQITNEDVRNELRKLEKNAAIEASNAFANAISNLPTPSVSAEVSVASDDSESSASAETSAMTNSTESSATAESSTVAVA